MNTQTKFQIGDQVTITPHFTVFPMLVNKIREDGYIECIWTEFGPDSTTSVTKCEKIHPKNLHHIPAPVHPASQLIK